MAAPAFEPMSIGQILDRTFSIYKRNFVRFLTIVAVVTVPLRFAYVGGSYAFLRISAESGAQGPPEFGAGHVAGMVLSLFIMLLGNSLCTGALLHGVSEFYLGNSVSVGEAYRRVLPRLVSLVLASILVVVVSMFGFLLLIVPGVIFLLRFWVTMPAIVVEDLGATKGMGRSWRLAAGNTGKILGLSLCIWIIGLVVGSVFGAAGLLAASQLPGLAQMFFTQFVDLLANILVMPIGVTATILMYYDLRIRKEGFDLEMLAERLAAEGGGGDVMAMPQ